MVTVPIHFRRSGGLTSCGIQFLSPDARRTTLDRDEVTCADCIDNINKPLSKPEIRPFSCGSQYGDWRSRNCDRCVKSYDNQTPQPKNGMGPCDIDNAIGLAYLGSGSVSREIGERMGFKSVIDYGWDCPEREINESR